MKGSLRTRKFAGEDFIDILVVTQVVSSPAPKNPKAPAPVTALASSPPEANAIGADMIGQQISVHEVQ
jgi:hypothetical protein